MTPSIRSVGSFDSESPAGLRPRPTLLTTLVAIALACCLLARPEQSIAGWQTFNVDNGLSSNRVSCMLQDHAGNFWFSTYDNGISRYDGWSWTSFTRDADGDGLNGLSLLEDRDGTIWVGAGFGVSRFDGTSWHTFGHTDGMVGFIAAHMLQDRAGNIWVGMQEGGVNRYDGTSWRGFTTADGLASDNVFSMMEDHAGNLWLRTTVGVSRYDGAQWTNFSTSGIGANDPRILLEDRAGNIWVATRNGVTRYDGTAWRTFTTADGLGSNVVRTLLLDRSGNVWAGTMAGLSRYDGTTWRTFTTADGLGSSYVISMLADHEGRVWIGTNGGGVSRFDGKRWRTFAGDSGPSDIADMIVEDRVGNLWFANQFAGASRFDGATWRTFTTADGLTGAGDVNSGDGYVTSMVVTPGDTLWFGTQTGVSRYDGESWHTFVPSDGLADSVVLSALRDRAGNMWFGTYRGVSRYDGTSWRTFTVTDGLASAYVYAMAEDRGGNLWFGGDRGVTRYDGTSWQVFDTANGLAIEASVVFADRSGNVWIPTEDGVSRYDGSSWRNFTTADGVPSSMYGVSFAEDLAGNLWLGSNPSGLTRYDGSSWRAYIPPVGVSTLTIAVDRAGYLWCGGYPLVGRFDGTNWRIFTPADGLSGNDVAGILADHDGNLWFGSRGGGVTRCEVDRVPPLTVFLTRPQPLSTSRNQSAAFTVGFGESRVEYSYRLDDGPWSSWSPVGNWVGNDLEDGVHAIQVRSRDYSTNVDSAGVVARFEIDGTPPAPIVAAPAFGQAVKNRVDLHGTAADARFKSYAIAMRPAGAATWDPPVATLLASSTTPVANGLLATWDTSSLPDGDYDVRLAVTDTLGLTGTAQVTVTVDNHAPYADVTAPAKVSAAGGGNIYTTHDELHLYFPPHAFDEDATVAIAIATAPDALPSGATRIEPGYTIGWGQAAMRKAATLEFSTAGRTQAPGTPAIYFSADGTDWQREGGTNEGGKVTLTIQRAGRYALYAETSVSQGAATLSELSFTPRVFSPHGTFGNTQVGIGFTLGRSAPVTVRVYNRAGRLMREVASGQTLPPGSNLMWWDGRDRDGSIVEDGLYLVTVEALSETRKSPLAVVR